MDTLYTVLSIQYYNLTKFHVIKFSQILGILENVVNCTSVMKKYKSKFLKMFFHHVIFVVQPEHVDHHVSATASNLTPMDLRTVRNNKCSWNGSHPQ